MNVGIMLPKDGYLQQLREVTRRHNVLLIFDEVKTGVTVAPGGITELYPVEPDLICLAKSIGGGGAIFGLCCWGGMMRPIKQNERLYLGTIYCNTIFIRAGLLSFKQN